MGFPWRYHELPPFWSFQSATIKVGRPRSLVRHQNSRTVWLNQILMLSINNGHPTVKSWYWAIFSFRAISLFVLHKAPSVSRQFCTLSIRKSCTVVKLIYCNQYRLWAGDFVCWAYVKLCTTIRFICRGQCRMLSIRKNLFRIQIYLLQLDLFAAINVVC